MEKVDFKKLDKELYMPKLKTWHEIFVPSMTFFMIDGKGNPNNSKEYGEAIATLFAVSYAAKFYSKKSLNRDYSVLPLEGLWWADDYSVFEVADKNNYHWTMMIRQPDWLSPEELSLIQEQVRLKKPDLSHKKLRVEKLEEGLSLQLMHIGSYDDEAPKIKELHEEILPKFSMKENGLHHEIYLGDPRRSKPENLKTVLRQPVIKYSVNE